MSAPTATASRPVMGGWSSMRKVDGLQAASRPRETLQFRLIYLVSFVVFLLAAIVGRLAPNSWRRGQQGKSIFGEAKSAADTVVPFVFMA